MQNIKRSKISKNLRVKKRVHNKNHSNKNYGNLEIVITEWIVFVTIRKDTRFINADT